MGLFSSPTSYRINAAAAGNNYGPIISARSNLAMFAGTFDAGPEHPELGHLILLVFEAVLEVVCVSLPGYIVARQGMFNAENQKFVANLNVALFTPCLSTSCHVVLRVLCAKFVQSSQNWLPS